MMEALQKIFTEFNEAGQVRLEYTTHVYYGHLAGAQ
jgi:hypothetical protein